MTREEQIIKIGAQFAIDETDGQTSGRAASMRGVLLSAFRAGAQWADSYPNWIPVEDELPKERGQYFVYTAADQSWQSEWMQDKSGEWHWFCSPMTVGTIANVTHWMPIVPPRKEDKI